MNGGSDKISIQLFSVFNFNSCNTFLDDGDVIDIFINKHRFPAITTTIYSWSSFIVFVSSTFSLFVAESVFHFNFLNWKSKLIRLYYIEVLSIDPPIDDDYGGNRNSKYFCCCCSRTQTQKYGAVVKKMVEIEYRNLNLEFIKYQQINWSIGDLHLENLTSRKWENNDTMMMKLIVVVVVDMSSCDLHLSCTNKEMKHFELLDLWLDRFKKHNQTQIVKKIEYVVMMVAMTGFCQFDSFIFICFGQIVMSKAVGCQSVIVAVWNWNYCSLISSSHHSNGLDVQHFVDYY